MNKLEVGKYYKWTDGSGIIEDCLNIPIRIVYIDNYEFIYTYVRNIYIDKNLTIKSTSQIKRPMGDQLSTKLIPATGYNTPLHKLLNPELYEQI